MSETAILRQFERRLGASVANAFEDIGQFRGRFLVEIFAINQTVVS